MLVQVRKKISKLFLILSFQLGYSFVSINYCAVETNDIYVTNQYEILKIPSTDQSTAMLFAGSTDSKFQNSFII